MEMTEREQEIADRVREEALGEIHRLDTDVGGFLVVQKLPDTSSPSLYRVSLEEQVDGSESLHWELLGSVNPDESDADDSHTPL